MEKSVVPNGLGQPSASENALLTNAANVSGKNSTRRAVVGQNTVGNGGDNRPRGMGGNSSQQKNSKRPFWAGKWTRRIGAIGIGAGTGSGFLPFDPLCRANAIGPWPLNTLGGFLTRRQPTKNILILMSNTGGGHKASADALKTGFEQLHPGKFEVNIVDLWVEHTPYPFNQLPKSYSFLVKNAWMWRFLYYGTNPRAVHGTYMAIAAAICYKSVAECLERYDPDLVVSVHPLMQHVPLKAISDRMREGDQKPIAFATVVTDFTTCHNSWFHPGVTQCFVPTDFCANIAKKLGLRDEQITVHGLPIRPDFSKQLPAKAVLRRRLRMNKDKPAVLLVGGGEGMGKLEQIVSAISSEVGAACQVVVICGRNQKLAQKLKSKKYPEGMEVHVNGFVNNMNQWMTACDCVITKAGPGTIAEALICGTPILLNGFVPGQEKGNIPYVLENKVGAFEKRPKKIAAVIKNWFTTQQDVLKEMSQRAKALGRPEALFRIVEDLVHYCEHPFLFGHAEVARQLA